MNAGTDKGADRTHVPPSGGGGGRALASEGDK